MSVIAPKGGYDFAEKRQYRRHVWNTIAGTSFIDPKRAQIMLMPSLEGDEIDVAKAKGFRVANMHIVDFSPAVIATLRRRNYGAFTGYGCTVAEACRRAAANGVRLRAANFDFTGCVSGSLLSEVVAVAEADCYAPLAVVAMNMLRGRESGDMGRAITDGTFTDGDATLPLRHGGGYDLLPSDTRRIKVMTGAFSTVSGRLPIKLARGIYRSGTQTMLWCVTAFASGGGAVPSWAGRYIEGVGFSTDWDEAGRDAVARREYYRQTGVLLVQGGPPPGASKFVDYGVTIKLQRPREG